MPSVPQKADVTDGEVNVPMRLWVVSFAHTIEAHHAELTELDRIGGDGDFGNNMVAGSQAAIAHLTKHSATTSGAFAALSEAFLDIGGTSGPLFGSWFRQFAAASQGSGAKIVVDELATGAARGAESVMRLGRTQLGDKTMVDAMLPASSALTDASERGANLGAALQSAAAAARTGASGTTALTARRGRATYVGETALGSADAGAVAVALFFESGLTLGT